MSKRKIHLIICKGRTFHFNYDIGVKVDKLGKHLNLAQHIANGNSIPFPVDGTSLVRSSDLFPSPFLPVNGTSFISFYSFSCRLYFFHFFPFLFWYWSWKFYTFPALHLFYFFSDIWSFFFFCFWNFLPLRLLFFFLSVSL